MAKKKGGKRLTARKDGQRLGAPEASAPAAAAAVKRVPSLKARRRTDNFAPRHEATSAELHHAAAARRDALAAQAVPTPAKFEPLWDATPQEVPEQGAEGEAPVPAPAPLERPPRPLEEALRYAAAAAARARLARAFVSAAAAGPAVQAKAGEAADACGADAGTPYSAPSLAFERWQLADALQLPVSDVDGAARNGGGASGGSAARDDLVRAGLAAAEAQRVVRECAAANRKAAAAIEALFSGDVARERKKNRKRKRASPGSTDSVPDGIDGMLGGGASVLLTSHKHTVDVSLQIQPRLRQTLARRALALPPTSLLLKANHKPLEKLRTLFKRHGSFAGEKVEEQEFHNALFCLLLRYHGAAGHGFHAALPASVFGALKEDFGVTCECFASPLNCFFDRFCSAHYDVDAAFGSLGSFFDFQPVTGSYEVNPPFVEAVMARAVAHCEALLERSEGGGSTSTSSSTSSASRPLAFLFVMPGWRESAAFRRLERSRWNRGQLLIAAADHGYVDGASHQRRDRHRAAPYDTLVVFLQNRAAARRGGAWQVTDAKLTRLRAAFARGIPTAAEAQRRLKAGRGCAPEDGGGGVYRGKKKNRRGPEPGAGGWRRSSKNKRR